MIFAFIELVITAVVAGVVGFFAGAATVALGRRGAAGASSKALSAATPPDLLSATLVDVRAGGLLLVKNMGDDFENVDLAVDRFDRFVAGREEWHVLEGTYKNRPVGIEWQKTRNGLRAWEHKRLRALTAEQVGLGGAALDALAVGKTHTHDGVTYTVDVAGKAMRHEGGIGFGKEHEAWRLLSADGKRVLHVERWPGKPLAAWAGEALDPMLVEIFKVK